MKKHTKTMILAAAAVVLIAMVVLWFVAIAPPERATEQKNPEQTAVPDKQVANEQQGGVPTDKPEQVTVTPKPTSVPKMTKKMRQLYEQNSDIAAWISIEGTVIDYPVMFTPEDEEHYLYLDFEGNNDLRGCLFIDEGCSLEPRSTNILIHGHNMKDGTMFSSLMLYKEKDFFYRHPVIEYSTLYEEETYEIFAVFLSEVYRIDDDVFKYYKFFNAQNEEEFNEYITNVLDLALYDTGITPEYGDELIALSTCEYSTERGRLVVVGRKVE